MNYSTSLIPNARKLKVVLLAAVLVGTFVPMMGCDPGAEVTYRNETPSTVSVFSNALLETTLAPGEEQTFSVITYEGSRTYSARDESGRVLFREEYTWEDLKRMDWEIVITED